MPLNMTNERLEKEIQKISAARRIVVKVGTSTITHENGRMNLRRVEMLIHVLADIRNSGREIIFVTSGAIAVGSGRLGMYAPPSEIGAKQAAAAVGQCELMNVYCEQFSKYGYVAAQLLLTRDVVQDAKRKKNVINTLSRLLELNAIPIINENDTVAVDEIESGGRFGDNDALSAVVAKLAGADALILLTDIDGLYTADPRIHPDAHRVKLVETIDDGLLNTAGGAGSQRGTGGMATKVQAAKIAAEVGIPTVIMDGKDPKRIYDLMDCKPVGTIFASGGNSL